MMKWLILHTVSSRVAEKPHVLTPLNEVHDLMLYLSLTSPDRAAATSVSILALLKRLIFPYIPSPISLEDIGWTMVQIRSVRYSDQWSVSLIIPRLTIAIGLVASSHGPADHSDCGLRLLVPCEWGYYDLMRIIQLLRIVTFVCQIEP